MHASNSHDITFAIKITVMWSLLYKFCYAFLVAYYSQGCQDHLK